MINKLHNYDFNCSVFNSYDYDDCLSLNDLLCKFFTKINECIEASNKALTFTEWLKEVGLKQEVVTLLTQWKDDGTLAELISEQILTEIKQNIEKNKTSIEELKAKDITIDSEITLLKEKDTSIDGEIVLLKEKDTSIDGEISLLKNKDTELKSDITRIDSEIVLLKNKDTSIDENISQLQNVDKALKSSIAETNAKFVTIVVRSQEELRNALGKYRTIICDFAKLDLSTPLKIPSNTTLKTYVNTEVTSSGLRINNYFINDSDGTRGEFNANKNIIIDGFTFNGEGRYENPLTMVALGHSMNCEILNCTFKDLHIWHMIELNGCKFIKIHHNKFNNYGNKGASVTEAIQLDSAINSTVFPWFPPYDNTACEDIEISYNHFNNIGLPNLRASCIGNHSFQQGITTKRVNIKGNIGKYVNTFCSLDDYYTLNIEDNIIGDVGLFAYFKARLNYTTGLSLINNTMGGWPEYVGEQRLIMIENYDNNPKVDRVRIIGNKVRNMSTHGIGVTGNDICIMGNMIRDTKGAGIYAYGGWGYTISDNILYNCGDANSLPSIIIGGNTKKETKGFTVTGNVCSGYTKTGEINVTETKGVGIIANNVAQVTGSGSNFINQGNKQL